jgi:hypothetical protein
MLYELPRIAARWAHVFTHSLSTCQVLPLLMVPPEREERDIAITVEATTTLAVGDNRRFFDLFEILHKQH